MKTLFINQLPQAIQEEIKKDLIELDLTTEDLENALDSRLCDLEDTIDINKYL